MPLFYKFGCSTSCSKCSMLLVVCSKYFKQIEISHFSLICGEKRAISVNAFRVGWWLWETRLQLFWRSETFETGIFTAPKKAVASQYILTVCMIQSFVLSSNIQPLFYLFLRLQRLLLLYYFWYAKWSIVWKQNVTESIYIIQQLHLSCPTAHLNLYQLIQPGSPNPRNAGRCVSHPLYHQITVVFILSCPARGTWPA